ncbi:MAG: sirohydrochlorin chelatase [Elusimicrobiota bacterium]
MRLKEASFIGIFLGGLCLSSQAQAEPEWPRGYGVLVMAHGGSPAWNAAVERAVAAAKLKGPAEIFFGMAAMPEERDALAEALARLRKAGAEKVAAIPFLVSSHSEVYRQYQYMLGLRKEPGFDEADLRAMAAHGGHGGHGHHAPVPSGPLPPVPTAGLRVSLLRALDDSPELLAVLKDRARALSRRPGRERLILAAHGPNGEDDDALWLANLETLARDLREDLGFREARVVTVRDDAPPAVREEAARRFRELASPEEGDVLVVPVLVAAGGIERGVRQRLDGLDVKFGEPLLEHAALSRWIARRAAEGASADDRGARNIR